MCSYDCPTVFLCVPYDFLLFVEERKPPLAAPALLLLLYPSLSIKLERHTIKWEHQGGNKLYWGKPRVFVFCICRLTICLFLLIDGSNGLINIRKCLFIISLVNSWHSVDVCDFVIKPIILVFQYTKNILMNSREISKPFHKVLSL